MDRSVDVRGTALAVSEQGSGAPFLWAHGLTSSRAHEDESGLFDWASALGGVRLLRYDARGHGDSGATADPGDYRWDALAGDLLALADALGLGRFVAGGASMGAATVLHAAVAAPERIGPIVLVIPPTAWETRKAQREMYEATAGMIESVGLAAVLDAAAAVPPPAVFADEPDLVDFDPTVAEDVLPTVMRGAAASDLPDPERLRSLSQPALVLAWDTDPTHPVSTAERLAELLPEASLHVAASLAEVRTWPASVAAFLRAVI